MENAWIGAIALHSKWQWITTGEILPSVTGSDEYPPWMLKSSREDTGCVLLDRHKCDYTVFVDISCDRKRSFVCEHTVNLEVDSPQEVEVKLPNRTVVIYTIKKTWIAASRFCISKGARLIILPNMEDIDALMDGMADHPNEVKHVWVGGELRDSSWVWAATGEAIPDGFSAWSSEPVSPSRSCLNLDRQAYTRPLLYGLHCNVSQPFVCESDPGVGHSTVEPSNTTSNTTTKKDFEEYDVHILRDLGNIDEMTTATSHILSTSTTTPKQYPKGAVCKAFVPHGEWVDCKPSPNGMLECSLYCDGLFFSVFGSREVNCSYEDEEVIGYRNLTTRPQCMHEAQLVKYLHFRLHHLHTETKLADSILFLVDGNYVAYARTVEFLKAIIRTIPVNTQFPAGMISYAGPQYMMRLNGTEVCQVKRRMLQMAEERHNDGVVDIGKAFLLARNEILDFQRKHCIIILCWNGTRDVPDPESYRETIADLKSKGHYIFGVSEEMDTNRQLEPFVTENEEKKELDLFVFHTIEQYTLWLNFKEHEIDPLRKC